MNHEHDSMIISDSESEIVPPLALDIDTEDDVGNTCIKEGKRMLEASSSSSGGGDGEHGPKQKKEKVDTDHKNLEKKIEEMEEKLFRKVDDRMDNIEKLIKDSKSDDTKKMPVEKDLDNVGLEMKLIECMMASIDLESVEKCLIDLDFGKVEETEDEIVYYCKTCFENNPPPLSDKNVTGCFTLDLQTLAAQKITKPDHQPRSLRNLKINIKNHIQTTQIHQMKVQQNMRKKKIISDRESRNRKVGLNLFRIRYSGLQQHRPISSFEEDILTAKLNGTDVGDLNHSRHFAKEIDTAVFETMKEDIKEALATTLDATNQKRPLGLLFDKMTPSKETGQIHAIVIPVPENNLSQPLIVPVCLDVPPVTDHSIAGLAELVKAELNKIGADDSQVEGIAVDGEYVKKGIKKKLLELLDLPDMSNEEKDGWISMTWDPAHELELAVKDVRKDSVYEWLEKIIKQVNDATELLNIGKGLQESKKVAEELGEKLYKLRNISSTRFVGFFASCLVNNERSLAISIEVLREKSINSTNKDLREKAGVILKKWKTQEWMMINLGLIDIFNLLGQISKRLQQVEIFPWEIAEIQEELILSLGQMASIKLTDDEGTVFDSEFNKNLWPVLSRDIDNILKGEYKGQNTTVFNMFRRGRSGDDIKQSSIRVLITVQNHLGSLCRAIANKFTERLGKEKDHKSAKLIKTMGDCLNIRKIIEKGSSDEDFNTCGEESLNILLGKAKYSNSEAETILDEYKDFRDRIHEFSEQNKLENDMMRLHEHLLYSAHECDEGCPVNTKCKNKGNIAIPKQPLPFKFLHLFLKKEEFYNGIQNFLHFLLRCVIKTHAETVVESMGNLIEMHCEKRRGLGIEDVGKETFIDWNGPPVHQCDSLGIKAMNRIFKGSSWRFVTVANKADSTVTKRLKQQESRLPFF